MVRQPGQVDGQSVEPTVTDGSAVKCDAQLGARTMSRDASNLAEAQPNVLAGQQSKIDFNAADNSQKLKIDQ
jgi:hypothetical protein